LAETQVVKRTVQKSEEPGAGGNSRERRPTGIQKDFTETTEGLVLLPRGDSGWSNRYMRMEP